MKLKISFSGLALLLFYTHSLKAQSCLENLYKANKMLDVGNTDECLALARPCSVNSEDESARWQAYRLMSIAYLLRGNNDSARMAAENFLDINPTYKPSLLKDPKEFINVLNKIVVIPKFTLGLAFSAGTNSSFPRISKGYVVSDYNKTYTSRNGFQFGTNLGFQISPKLVAELGLIANNKTYNIDYSPSNWKVNVRERLTYLDMPLSVKYIFRPQKKLRFFLHGGAFAGYLLYVQNDFKSTYTPQDQDFELKKLDISERRNRLNVGLIGGLGVYYKVKQGHWSIYANYFRSFSQINKEEKRYDYQEQIYTYYYLDDDIIIDNLAISVGYTYYLNYKVYRSKKQSL